MPSGGHEPIIIDGASLHVTTMSEADPDPTNTKFLHNSFGTVRAVVDANDSSYATKVHLVRAGWNIEITATPSSGPQVVVNINSGGISTSFNPSGTFNIGTQKKIVHYLTSDDLKISSATLYDGNASIPLVPTQLRLFLVPGR